jgi:septal ring factor EnvC (AmiA/AmiB activator)
MEAQTISEANKRIQQIQRTATQPRRSVLDRPNSLSNRDLLLARHRAHKVNQMGSPVFAPAKAQELPKPVIGSLVSRFLNKLAAGVA